MGWRNAQINIIVSIPCILKHSMKDHCVFFTSLVFNEPYAISWFVRSPVLHMSHNPFSLAQNSWNRNLHIWATYFQDRQISLLPIVVMAFVVLELVGVIFGLEISVFLTCTRLGYHVFYLLIDSMPTHQI